MKTSFIITGTSFAALCTLAGVSISAADWNTVGFLTPFLALAGTMSLAIALDLASTPRSTKSGNRRV